MTTVIPERRLAEIWQSSVRRRRDLVTAGDGPVEVIYPGRLNDGRGADLKDAVISTAHGLFKGDIEFHVKSSQWQEHGHHLDPAYNQVILHVVYEHDTGGKARRQNGLEIPTLPLANLTETQPGRRLTSAFTPDLPAPCIGSADIISNVLEQAGEARFRQKTLEYEEALLRSDPEQTLYRGMMTALGYAKNKDPMSKLAEAVPYRELAAIMRDIGSDEDCRVLLSARLLGGAGLLPSQRPGKPADTLTLKLEQAWQKSGNPIAMSDREWEFFKVRPGNYPDRRILAMAALLTKMRKGGLEAELADIILKPGADDGHMLEAALLAPAAAEGKGPGGAPALLGKERAGEIIINVILPFFAAGTATAGHPELPEKAFNIYGRYRAGAENSLEKHMRNQLKLPAKTCDTAIKRQGLIHIYKTLCTQGRCAVCPLSRNSS